MNDVSFAGDQEMYYGQHPLLVKSGIALRWDSLPVGVPLALRSQLSLKNEFHIFSVCDSMLQ